MSTTPGRIGDITQAALVRTRFEEFYDCRVTLRTLAGAPGGPAAADM
jgi:hypothetical protein